MQRRVLVWIARVHVGPGCEQHLQGDWILGVPGRDVQGRGAVAIARVHVSARRQYCLQNTWILVQCRCVQQIAVDKDLACVPVGCGQQRLDNRGVPVVRRRQPEGPCVIITVRVDRRRQHLDDRPIRVVARGGLQRGIAAMVPYLHVGAGRQQHLDHRRLPAVPARPVQWRRAILV